MRRVLPGIPLLCLLQLATACAGHVSGEDNSRPPRGFYWVTTVTRNDTCSPSIAQGTREQLAGGNHDVVGVSLWEASFVFDMPWTGGAFELDRCHHAEELTTPLFSVVYEVNELTPRSYELDSRWDWTAPGACPERDSAENFPTVPCSLEMTQTYELSEACPATRNGLSCSAPNH